MNEQLVNLPGGRVAGHVKVERFVGPIEDGVCNGIWEFHNLILNTGLDYFCSYGGILADTLSRCSVGTSNTAPAAGQTLLLGAVGSALASADLGGTYVSGVAPYVQRAIQYDFAVGAIVATIAEIGIGPGTYNVTPLVARALVLDGGGSPTTVSVLVTESLRVTYYIRNYIATTDGGGVVTIGGINYTYVVRAAAWNISNNIVGGFFPGLWGTASGQLGGSWIFHTHVNMTGYGVTGLAALAAFSTQTLSTIDLYPANTGGAVGCGTNAIQSYTAGDYYKDNIITIGLTQANSLTGGIGSIVYGGLFGLYQMNFTPQLPKTALNAFALRLRITISNYP